MKPFMGENFLLQSDSAERLYHDFAAGMPILDYHCHLPPEQIASDHQFENLADIWLAGDHYKWRAMRTHGVEERYITGNTSWIEKFARWAETVPCALRNPLYHWTHLELQRYFGITEQLSPATAAAIYESATNQLQQPEFSARNLMRRMNVEMVCTTDDPVDNLFHHRALRDEGFEIDVRPGFRPDKALNLRDPVAWKAYHTKLEQASGMSIRSFTDLMSALEKRMDYFHGLGGRLSDHGLEYVPAAEATPTELDALMARVLNGQSLSRAESDAILATGLLELGRMYHARGWVQQYHVGVFRNANSRRFAELGPDTGFDTIGDFRQAPGLLQLFNELDRDGRLPKTILYNINPADNELLATMAGCFQGDGIPGKIQFGSGWWFLDQKDGMEKQLNALSALGLLSRFVGMLTDSRSFLSYPRHEYFRRILCNLLGAEMERGELPGDFDLVGAMVKNISSNNVRTYLG